MKNQPIVSISLKQDHSIRGVIEKKGSVHSVHKGCADDLIKRGIAQAAATPKSE